jgi:hypothetical protein
MGRLSDHHKTLTNGVGKCSVPMWGGGMPAGFCDQPAFGERPPCRSIWHASQQRQVREDGRYDGYVPALACPAHGGPKLVTQKDGDAWMAALPGFTNLQECETGWGETEEKAVADLLHRLIASRQGG